MLQYYTDVTPSITLTCSYRDGTCYNISGSYKSCVCNVSVSNFNNIFLKFCNGYTVPNFIIFLLNFTKVLQNPI